MFETENGSPEPAPEATPSSPARQRLAALIEQRAEAQASMSAAQAGIRKLQGAQSLAGPFEAALAQLGAKESEAYRLWSEDDSAAPAPAPDVAAREDLARKINQARVSADAAASAIPLKEAEYLRASNKAAGTSHGVAACISEILISEVAPCYDEIVQMKRQLAAAIARAEYGREFALKTCEAIPAERRPAVAGAFYQALGAVDSVRALAIANPAPSYDRGPWVELARALSADASATVEA